MAQGAIEQFKEAVRKARSATAGPDVPPASREGWRRARQDGRAAYRNWVMKARASAVSTRVA